ncbi:YicC/YloC family endoribonuclease [Candidatus Tachikawaea gelatinosa]|nr:YicC/YloC family endoribonuclease [Candidatus Tachikawaea gelatinosa]
MTAYARYEKKNKWGDVLWELRSVNQRYLEININLPEILRNLEENILKKIRQRLSRGKIDCTLHFEKKKFMKNDFIINKKLIRNITKLIDSIVLKNHPGIINLIEILKWPGVISVKKFKINQFNSEILENFDTTLDNLIHQREREGAILKTIIEKKLKSMLTEIKKIFKNIPIVIEFQRNRLLKKMKEIPINNDFHRFEQELLMMLCRMDISEELDRIKIHTKEIFNILNDKKIVGRRLEFMIQELNRESNTLASKSINENITASAIELKILIEQVREQIQNIE